MDIKAARTQFDCREEIDKLIGPARGNMYLCPFHDENTPSFHVYPEGYHCFGCNAHGDIFDFWAQYYNKPLGEILREHQIDPQEEIRRKQEYLEREAVRIKKQLDDLQRSIEELRNGEAWIRYYEMDEKERIRQWERRGVPAWYQDWTYLGYDPNHHFWIGEDYFTPTLTIPVYEAGTREVLNIRHRLLNPPESGGKYRPERSGLPASLYVANPDEPLSGKTILVEGEIKAMVTWVTHENGAQVVGSPSKNLSKDMFEQLSDCNPIYYIPDPDVDRQTLLKAVNEFRDRDFYVIRLPEKIDDLILSASLDGRWLKKVMENARKV